MGLNKLTITRTNDRVKKAYVRFYAYVYFYFHNESSVWNIKEENVHLSTVYFFHWCVESKIIDLDFVNKIIMLKCNVANCPDPQLVISS